MSKRRKPDINTFNPGDVIIYCVVNVDTMRKLHDRATFGKSVNDVAREVLEQWGRNTTRVVQIDLPLTE